LVVTGDTVLIEQGSLGRLCRSDRRGRLLRRSRRSQTSINAEHAKAAQKPEQ
jgi:hypothetical protein